MSKITDSNGSPCLLAVSKLTTLNRSVVSLAYWNSNHVIGTPHSLLHRSTNLRVASSSLPVLAKHTFASSGNRLSQLSGYQWLLRYFLLEELNVRPQNFHVFSPMTIKATAGKGNLKKDGMIQAFIESTDEQLLETHFWNDLQVEPLSFQNRKGGWLKIDDIVDSYWVLQTLEKHVEPFPLT